MQVYHYQLGDDLFTVAKIAAYISRKTGKRVAVVCDGTTGLITEAKDKPDRIFKELCFVEDAERGSTRGTCERRLRRIRSKRRIHLAMRISIELVPPIVAVALVAQIMCC